NWHVYGHVDGVLRRTRALTEVLGRSGVDTIEMWPVPGPSDDARGEMCIAVQPMVPDSQRMCAVLSQVTARQVRPSSPEEAQTFHARVHRGRLSPRQDFAPWDARLPCCMLGVDVDRGMDRWRRLRHPERWRLIEHQIDGTNIARWMLPAMMLE